MKTTKNSFGRSNRGDNCPQESPEQAISNKNFQDAKNAANAANDQKQVFDPWGNPVSNHGEEDC